MVTCAPAPVTVPQPPLGTPVRHSRGEGELRPWTPVPCHPCGMLFGNQAKRSAAACSPLPPQAPNARARRARLPWAMLQQGSHGLHAARGGAMRTAGRD
eukprot:363625-Chlamydomonas_euryale.AAC.10